MSRIIREADAQRDSRLLREFAASGISVGCANTVLNPVEVVKTRMQLAGAGSVPSNLAAATSGAKPLPPAAAAVLSSSTALPQPSAARYISHSTALSAPQTSSAAAATAAAATSQSLGSPTARPWLLRQQLAAAAPTAAAEDALAASLRSAVASSSSPTATSTTAAAAAVTKRPGFVATAGIILRQDGVTGFTRGIQASAARAVCNGGIRLGLYDPIKTLMSHDGSGRDLHVGQKLAAGSISGGVGAVLTTPIELCKTRLQAPGATTRSMSEVVRSVIKQQGVLGLWSGATPSVLRLIMLNGSMCGTYDEVKTRIAKFTGWTSGVKLVLSSSMVAGVVTTTVINPADVIRAYMQTGRGKSLVGVARHIYSREGAGGFLKGWTAAYARTGPQTLIIFTVSEIVRPLFGLKVIGSQ